MKTVQCYKCKNEVEKNKKICPICGGPIVTHYSIGWLYFGIILFIIAIGFIYSKIPKNIQIIDYSKIYSNDNRISLRTKKNVFWDLFLADDKAIKETESIYGNKYPPERIKHYDQLLARYEKQVMLKYNITEKEKREISAEGFGKDWPRPEYK